MGRAGRDVKRDVKKMIKREKVAVCELPKGINNLLTGTATQQYKLSPLKML